MAKKIKKKSSRVKTKKKLWFSVIAPKLFANKEIGETYLPSHDVAVGRFLTVNIRELTGNMKDQNSQASFKITEFKNNALQTEVIGYKVTPAHIKRVVRKNTVRIDAYYQLKTKSDKAVVLKVLIVTRFKIQRSTRTDLARILGEIFAEELGKGEFAAFMSNVVTNRVQIGAKRKLTKICPIKEVAIRSLSLVQDKKSFGAAEEVVVVDATSENSEEEAVEAVEDPAVESTQESASEDTTEEEAPAVEADESESTEKTTEESGDSDKEE